MRDKTLLKDQTHREIVDFFLLARTRALRNCSGVVNVERAKLEGVARSERILQTSFFSLTTLLKVKSYGSVVSLTVLFLIVETHFRSSIGNWTTVF